MNIGTKLRTILVIATCLNTALMSTDITGFHNSTLDIIYKVVSIILNFIIVALATYFNNDYTEEACVHTGRMRHEKAYKKGQIDSEDYSEDYDIDGGENDGI